jgi:hypothetical protein
MGEALLMNRSEIKVGKEYYYFNLDTTNTEFLRVGAMIVGDRSCTFQIFEIYISKYKNLGQRILAPSKIYRSYGAALKKIGPAYYLGRYVVQSVFEDGAHEFLSSYGPTAAARQVWGSVYRRK